MCSGWAQGRNSSSLPAIAPNTLRTAGIAECSGLFLLAISAAFRMRVSSECRSGRPKVWFCLVAQNGNELLFGVSAGRKFSLRSGWAAVVGPEFFGETAIHSFSNGRTGFEGLLTGRLERMSDRPHLRFKAGIGHGIVQHFGAPEWRVLVGLELISQRPKS